MYIVSKRLYEVAILIKDKGMSNKEIAKELNITLRSVQEYVSILYSITGVNNSRKFMLWMQNNNFIVINNKRTETRLKNIKLVKELLSQGISRKQIQSRLNLSKSTVFKYIKNG